MGTAKHRQARWRARWMLCVPGALALAGCLDDGRPLAEYLAEQAGDGGRRDARPPRDARAPGDAAVIAPDAVASGACSVGGGQAVTARFINRSIDIVQAYWVDPDCNERAYGVVFSGQTADQSTFSGHVWRFRVPGEDRLVYEWPGAPLDTASGAVVTVEIR